MNQHSRRQFIKNSAAALAGLGAMPLALNCSKSGEQAEGGIQPNFILIFCDDMGYGDWERAGHPTIRTPNLNRMADQGVTITQFYCAASVCSPSRAALLTGRYPIRTGVVQVFFPGNKVGLPLSEKTLPELLKPQGYATACIGKWHLGHTSAYLPTERGFDSYFGIPYSNDMSLESRGDPPIPLMRDRDIIEQPCDQNTLTRRYTEESIKFIEANQRRPFFLYLAHSMPHVPLHVSDEFRGKSKRGLYGDVIEEIDWSAGEILRALDRLGIGENTLVIFTSDNGPWTTQLQQGGSAGLLRGAKGSTWEGGVRVPFIARYPDKLPAGAICPEVATTMDMFTTLLELSGADIPRDRIIDGVNILPVLQGRGASPRERFYYFHQDRLTAIRQGKFKLHFERTVKPYQWAKCNTYKLYDLEIDPSENYDIASQHPERVRQLTQLADDFRRQVAEAGENQELIDRLLRRGR